MTTCNDQNVDVTTTTSATARTICGLLLAGLARLIVLLGIFSVLVVVLVNEIITALVYTLVTLLTMWFGSCLS